MFSEKSMSPIDRQLSKKVVRIIHGLLMMEESAVFRKPVPHKALGLENYKQIIKKPTDLNLVRRQNNEGKYKFAEEVLDDIQLCWDNCKLYNVIGSDIYNQALFMEEAFDKFGCDIMPDFWSGVNREDYNQKFNEKKIEEEKKKPETKGAVHKKQLPQAPLVKEDPAKLKIKKKVTFNNRSADQQQPLPEQVPLPVVENKQKQSNPVSESMFSHPPEVMQAQKVSMEIEEEEHPQMLVDPIFVNLALNPSKEQITELSQKMKTLYMNEDYSMLEKVVEVLHANQKQNMSLNKNGQMNFKMSKIHISTYYRLRKILDLPEEHIAIIQ